MCCSLKEKISLWWKEEQAKDVNFLTLKIKDKVLREKFLNNELREVKKRWEISTVMVLLFYALISLSNLGDKDAAITLAINTGDVCLVLILMSLLGRKW